MHTQTAQDIIRYYSMLPHPEGGYYKETYRSNELIQHHALPQRFAGSRSFSTAIYFLLDRGNFSAFHRIKSDECWHFYAGGPLLIYIIHPGGSLQSAKLGSNIFNDETFQFVVPAGCWFASVPADETAFSFAGCTVAPGFDFADFELAQREELTTAFPRHELIIKQLTR